MHPTSEVRSFEEPIPARRATRAVALSFPLLFGLASIVLGMVSITVNIVLLPMQVAVLDPEHKETTFAVILAFGALAAVITTPVVGALSDRTRLWGKRRPWIALGALLTLVAFLLLATAHTIPQLAVGMVLSMMAGGMLLAALTALLPETFPVEHRALGASLVGMGPLLGNAIGGILIAQVTPTSIPASYELLGTLVVGISLLFALTLHEEETPNVQGVPLRLAAFWINPRTHPDFVYTWLSRLFIFFAWTTLSNFILYFLHDVVHYEHVSGQPLSQGTQIYFAISTLAVLLASLLTGHLSDRWQRRKGFVITSCALFAVGLLLLAFTSVWAVVPPLAIVIGIGMGGYLSSDLALATQVLPDEYSQGKDLGLMNTAVYLPMILSPLVAALVLSTFHSYPILFLVLAGAAVLAALAVGRVKTVR